MYGIDITDSWENSHLNYWYYGKLSEIDFLKRIYNLKSLPSYDDRFNDAEGDIWQHSVNNNDYENGWVFEDERFGLLDGEDEVLLNFLCAIFHPAVRVENGIWKKFLEAVNGLLQPDGYELYPESKISGRDVFGWKRFDPTEKVLFIPFSLRHEKMIKTHFLSQSISNKARNQIVSLLERYNITYRETNETGLQYDITTNECVFRDILQFYQPKAYDSSGRYVETSDMKHFILKTSAFCVFDFIEIYEKYNRDNDFSDKVNALLKLHEIPYNLKMGKLENIFDISINNKHISSIPETGLRELLWDAESYYKKGNKQIAVEKLWDALERLKTYYSPPCDKSQSVKKIIEDMSASDLNFRTLYETEFSALTKIGNDYRIRHHETTKIDITDDRQYEYFYKRCIALISVAIQYLRRGSSI